MHIFIKHIRESIKNNTGRNSFFTQKNSLQILNESEYEIVPNQPQSQNNPPPSSSGASWVWGPDGWTNYGSSSWSWDGANGQWISTVGTYGGMTFYMNENGEIFAQPPNNWITPQSMPAPTGYQYGGNSNSMMYQALATAAALGKPGADIFPGPGQPGISMGQIGHWFDLEEFVFLLMSGANPLEIVTNEDIQEGSSTPFSVSARTFLFVMMLGMAFETAFLSGWRWEASVSSSGSVIIRIYQMVGGIPTYLTSLSQSPFMNQLLYNWAQLSTQWSAISANIRNIVASGGVGALTSAQLLNVFGGAAGLQSFMTNLIAFGIPAAAMLGIIASIATAAYTVYSQTGTYTQDNIDNLLSSLLTILSDPMAGFSQFATAWQALFGTTAPNWFSSTSGIDWNSLPDWLRDFLIREVIPNSVPEPKPNLELIPAYDLQPGQPGWFSRTPTAEELNDTMDRYFRDIQSGSMGGNP